MYGRRDTCTKNVEILTNHEYFRYSGRKITESLGNVTVRGEKYGKSKGERDCQQSV
jgi:hypothetical protein